MSDRLIDYLTPDKPFGPEDAALITGPYTRRMLFQNENAIYKRLNQKPTVIMGRKGSGKTAFLHCSHVQNQYRVLVELNSASAFASMLRLVEEMGGARVPIETLAEIWEAIFWWALVFKVPEDSRFTRTQDRILSPALSESITQYLSGLAAAHNPVAGHLPVEALKYYQKEATAAAVDPVNVPNYIFTSKVNGVALNELRQGILSELEKHQARIVLIIDSLDPRVDSADPFDVRRDEAKASIGGLLKALGAFLRHQKNYEVRFALPSERHFDFLELSTNPAKDMANCSVMQWTAGDLVSVAAHRLKLFFKDYAEYHGNYVSRYEKLDPKKRKDAVVLLQAVLGKSVTNRLGIEESTISYVMRHTQLLPRHLLLFLNSICATARGRGERIEPVSGVSIRDGVLAVEQLICYEVFAAYQHKYPRCREVCSACIPDLPLQFSVGDLQVVFNRHGKRTMGTDDFDDFKRMFVEMGVIGRAKNDTDIYVEAEFEYAAFHKLSISTNDRLCLHPVFSQVFSARLTEDNKVIYPFGTTDYENANE